VGGCRDNGGRSGAETLLIELLRGPGVRAPVALPVGGWLQKDGGKSRAGAQLIVPSSWSMLQGNRRYRFSPSRCCFVGGLLVVGKKEEYLGRRAEPLLIVDPRVRAPE
jgi:hypothetical protein